MRALAVIFSQPALCNFPCFIQRSEQIKIQYFCPVSTVETFDKGILCGLAGPDKLQHHAMFFCPLCQRQRDQLRTVIHPHFQRISAVCHDPVQHSHDPLRRDIQVNFDRQCFAVKIIHHVEGPEASAAHQRIVHNRWTSSGSSPLASPAEPDYALAGAVFPYGENSVSAGSKYGEPFYGSMYCPVFAAPEKAF